MKKQFSNLCCIIAALTAILALAACNRSGGSGNAASRSATAGNAQPLRILFSATYNETETGGQIIKYFVDQVTALSGGTITVNVNWGGTLFDSIGEFDAISEGAVNMVAFGHPPHTGTLNYLGFPMFAPGGTQSVLNYFNELIFNNPETSALIQQEAAEHNMKYLNVIAGGANAFCAAYRFTDLAGMVANSKSFGNFMAAQWESLGFQVTSITPPDIYDGMNRGLIDASQMGFAPMVALAWYEVAPYWALDGTYTAGNMFTVNLDWWNGLRSNQQDSIQKAAAATEAYSATLYDQAIAADKALVEEKTGYAFVEFNQADLNKLWASCFEASADAALVNAERNGKREGMVKILKAAAEITNYNWQP